MRTAGRIILIIAAALLAPGCNQKDKLKVQQLEEELSALQGEQMPGVPEEQSIIGPESESFCFEFDAAKYGVDAGGSVSVGYSLPMEATVEAMTSGGWSATVSATDGRSGHIVVTCPDPAIPVDIVVTATTPDGRSTAATLPILVRDPYTDATRTDVFALAYFCFDRTLATDYHFQMMADAGFNMLTIEYVDNWQEQLELAQKYGLKGVLFINGPAGQYYSSGGTSTLLAEVVGEARNYPALYGYQIADEPIIRDIEQFVYERDAVAALDPDHPVYINMYPGMPSYWSPTLESYRELVETYTTRCKLDFITFDQYPVFTSGIDPSWIPTLNIIRDISRSHSIPFWAFTLCCREVSRVDPNLENIRLQCNTNLAFGAQVNQYFVYHNTSGTNLAPLMAGWIRQPDGNYSYVEPYYTSVYDDCKTYNTEMHNRGYVFAGCDVYKLRYSFETDPGGLLLSKSDHPAQISSFSASDKMLVSFVENRGNQYLVAVNQSWQWPVRVDVTFTEMVYVIDRDGGFVEMLPGEAQLTVEAGDMLVIKYK